MILRPLFFFKVTQNTGLLLLNSYGGSKRVKTLADNRKSHHPIETVE